MKARFACAALALLIPLPAVAQIAATDAQIAAARAKLEAGLSAGKGGDAPRNGYRSQLERRLLESGSDAEVIIKGTQLTVWTHLNRAVIFSFVTDGKILEGAREAGFKTVDFFDKGGQGHWVYDVTKPGNCDIGKRLCY